LYLCFVFARAERKNETQKEDNVPSHLNGTSIGECKMDDVISDILDECLARLADGATLDECLAAYPAWQAALEPPLRMAVRLRELPRPALPDTARARLETQVLALAGARRAAIPPTPASKALRARGLDAILAGMLRALGYGGPLSQPWLRLAGAAIAIVLALVLGAGALAAARAIVHVIQPQPPAAPTSMPTSTAPALALIALDGPIEQIAQEGWVVGGTTVALSSTTAIEGTPALGATVHVHGVVQNGGALLARSIVVEPLPTITSTPPPISMPTETPAPTATPVLTATLVPVVVPVPAPPDANDQPDDQKQPCQGQQRGRDEKKCDPKPHEDSKPPKPKPHKK